MANQIEIVIEAQNKTQKTLEQIQKDVAKMSTNVENSQKSLSNSFTKVQGAMLNVGQAANSVHNIFETLENSTRKLENAQDKLENAQIRLKQGTQDLAIAQRKLADIEEAHSRDANDLAQAQLNLDKAQNELNKLTMLGVTGGYVYRQAQIDVANAQADLTDAQKLGAKKSQELADAQQELKDKQESLQISTNNLERAQRALDKTISDVKWDRINVIFQGVAAVGNIAMAWKSLGGVFTWIGGLFASGGAMTGVTAFFAAIPGWGWAVLAIIGIIVGLITVFGKWGEVVTWLKDNIMFPLWNFLVEMWKWLQFIFLPFWWGITEAVNLLGKAFLWLKDNVFKPVYDFLANSVLPILEKVWDIITKITSGIGGAVSKVYSMATSARDSVVNKVMGSTKKVGDAIIRPNGQVIETDPMDTIYASKNGIGGGTTININGDNYGVDANEISKSIMKQLRKKIAI